MSEQTPLVIVCARPGLIRSGRAHPQVARCFLEDFSFEQLREMVAEPLLVLVVGERLTLDTVEALEEAHDLRVGLARSPEADLRPCIPTPFAIEIPLESDVTREEPTEAKGRVAAAEARRGKKVR